MTYSDHANNMGAGVRNGDHLRKPRFQVAVTMQRVFECDTIQEAAAMAASHVQGVYGAPDFKTNAVYVFDTETGKEVMHVTAGQYHRSKIRD